MDTTQAKKRGAKRPKRSSLRGYGAVTLDDIVEAALKVIERKGVSGLSMRLLADELQLSNMAVYYYVENKEKLLDVILDRVMSQTMMPVGPGSLASRVTISFYHARGMLRRYPGLAVLAMARATEPHRSAELVRALEAEGLSERQVQAAIFALACHFWGTINMDGVYRGTDAEFEQIVADSLMMLLSGIESGGAAPRASESASVPAGPEAAPPARVRARRRATS